MRSTYLLRTLSHYRLPQYREHLTRWGNARERLHHQHLVFPKRRRDWLLGRLTAKEMIQHYIQSHYGRYYAFNEIEILNSDTGQPYFRIGSDDQFSFDSRIYFSISHSRGRALCALAELGSDAGLGVDVEFVTSRPKLFADTFYDEDEKNQLATYCGSEFQQAETAIWSLKEAALKALGQGLKTDTYRVSVALTSAPRSTWTEQRITLDVGQKTRASAWMCFQDGYVLSWVMTVTDRNRNLSDNLP
ncbi:4'-phosphopantetheinyl transferase family protein [candidate division CSSED10-310 bacterium]|uniref:4'-phosphopantetheinyl transferase family protein n=1 Tax=candidate division CSSED10-310 bacterium TaxID=2855610 RepID=A0ABV6Z4R2_UNCC1